ncbi:Endo-1,4-beta-xylanase A precursor [compost metagenome]
MVTSTLGTGTITATYNGWGYYNPSSDTVNVLVEPGALTDTTTTVNASPNPSWLGQTVMLSAVVAPNQSGNAPIPTGTITFTGPNGYSETAGVNILGEAIVNASTLISGTITATYSGDANYNSSVGTTQITVNLFPVFGAPTTTNVSVSPDPSNVGELVTVTAAVIPLPPGVGTPAGTVTFTGPGGLNLTEPVNGAGVASILIPAFESGTITAVYNGDPSYSSSTGTASITVNSSSETVTSVTTSPNPSVEGQQVTVTATVAAINYGVPFIVTGPVTPTGTVTFTGPGGLNETVALNGLGQASLTTTTLETGTIVATYNGDSTYTGSTGSTWVIVNSADTTTTVTATPDQSNAGDPVTVTATVAAGSSMIYTYALPVGSGALPAVVIPGGTVTFTGPGGLNETVALDGLGQASFTSTTLVTGTITATYNGDGVYKSSTGTVNVTVQSGNTSNEETPSEEPAPSVGSGGGGGGGAPAIPAPSGVSVLVNGKAEEAGTLNNSTVNNKSVSTLKIDQSKLETKLAAEGQGAVVTVPVTVQSDVIVTALNGYMIQQMEQKQAILEIKTAQASYTLPAQQIHMSSISDKIGKSVALQDIIVQIQIAKSSEEALKAAQEAADKGSFSLVAAPVDFTITATYENEAVEVNKFDAFVERTIALPDGVDPSNITTGVVVDNDGTVRHIPTKVIVQDGKYYAVLNSMTNSSYSVVWHPLEFSDVASHWAKSAVNDMGSRMVIDGTGDNSFSPDRSITRAEFAAIFVRGLGLKLESGAAAFSDVASSDWYSSAVQTAYTYGLISGFEDGTFRPDESITREQAMVMVSRAMQLTGLKDKLTSQADVLAAYLDAADSSEWANDGITASVQAGLITGRDGDVLAPKASITRAEVAAVIQRLLQKSGLI